MKVLGLTVYNLRKIIAWAKWPIKANFGWPFLKSHSHNTGLLSCCVKHTLHSMKNKSSSGTLFKNEHSEIESETTLTEFDFFNCKS